MRTVSNDERTRIMKRHIYLLPLLLAIAACSTPKDYAYLKDAPRNEEMPIQNRTETVIKKGDNIYIYVYSQFPETTIPFNQETNTLATRKKPHGYDVDDRGDIIFPVIGRVHAEGLTPEDFARELEGKLVAGRYVSDPLVSLKITNYSVTVIGEVMKPSELMCDDNRLSILEAIAKCGDITMDGIRTNVKIIRTIGEDIVVDSVDLTSQALLTSPYYYLQQGDIVYVEPTPKKKRKAYSDDDWPHYIRIGTAAMRLAYLSVYRFLYNNTTAGYTH